MPTSEIRKYRNSVKYGRFLNDERQVAMGRGKRGSADRAEEIDADDQTPGPEREHYKRQKTLRQLSIEDFCGSLFV